MPSLSQRLFKQGGVYALSTVANQGITFLLLPLYAKVLGDAGFGVVELMVTVRELLALVFMQGLVGAWFRLRYQPDVEAELHTFETTVVWYLLGSGLVMVLAISLFGPWLARAATPDVPYFPLGLLTVAAAALNVYSMLYERRLQAQERPIAFALFTVLRTIVQLVAIIAFVVVLGRGVQGKLEADAIVRGGIALLALVLIRPRAPWKGSLAALRMSLRYGLPLVPHGVARHINAAIDRIIVNYLLGLAAVGVYSLGYRIASIATVVALALIQAFAPIFVRAMREADDAEARGDTKGALRARREITQTSLVLVTVVICMSLAICAVAREGIRLIATPEFADSWTVVPLVSAGVVAWACYFTFVQPIAYNLSRAWTLSGVSISAAAINVAGNFYLIPRFGIIGAAAATLASNSAAAVVAFWLGKAATPLPYHARRWGAVLGSCALGLGGFWSIDAAMDSMPLRLLTKVAWLIATVVAILLAANLGWSKFRALLKSPAG